MYDIKHCIYGGWCVLRDGQIVSWWPTKVAARNMVRAIREDR